MAIAQNLIDILAARYGRDVRQAIHDGIATNYADVSASQTLAAAAALNADTKAGLAVAATTNADAASLNANTKAGLANAAALNADTKAGLANGAAITANASASNADSKAGLANTKALLADAAALNADTKAGLANAATTNTNAAGGAANAAAGLANTAAANADVKAGLANTAAISADAKALLADTKAALANTKALLADTAALNADAKAAIANAAAGTADIATTNANASASNADIKASLANTKALLADAAALNADTKAGLANAATTNTNAATVSANAAAALANGKASLADVAALNADTKAGLANAAALNADTKAALADVATTTANGATTNANNAAAYANGMTQPYIHIKYSAINPIANTDMVSTPNEWIGVYHGILATPPAAYTAYTWYQFKGEPGDVTNHDHGGILNAGTIGTLAGKYLVTGSGGVIETKTLILGGVNLAPNTHYLSGLTGWTVRSIDGLSLIAVDDVNLTPWGAAALQVTGVVQPADIYRAVTPMPFLVGEIYTISFWLENITTGVSAFLSDGTAAAFAVSPLNQVYKKQGANLYYYYELQLPVMAAHQGATYLTIKVPGSTRLTRVKMELGTIVTDWSVTPFETHRISITELIDFPASLPASDVSAWAKTATKPTYTNTEVGATSPTDVANAISTLGLVMVNGKLCVEVNRT